MSEAEHASEGGSENDGDDEDVAARGPAARSGAGKPRLVRNVATGPE